MFIEMKLFFDLKWKYSHRFWSFIETDIIICSWLSVGIYVWRYREYSRIGKLFEETNGFVYINLQFSSYLNDLLRFIYGFCCFFGTIKLIYLCRFNEHIYLYIQAIKYAGKELISFSMMFLIVFISFVCLFYLLFLSTISSCSSLFQTAELLFQMTLMQFDAHQLIGAAAFLGPFCFSLFILLVVFVCLSMFFTIINQSFHRARQNLNKNNEGIYSFMFDQFLRWIGKSS
jgi:hypothetical protein